MRPLGDPRSRNLVLARFLYFCFRIFSIALSGARSRTATSVIGQSRGNGRGLASILYAAYHRLANEKLPRLVSPARYCFDWGGDIFFFRRVTGDGCCCCSAQAVYIFSRGLFFNSCAPRSNRRRFLVSFRLLRVPFGNNPGTGALSRRFLVKRAATPAGTSSLSLRDALSQCNNRWIAF